MAVLFLCGCPDGAGGGGTPPATGGRPRPPIVRPPEVRPYQAIEVVGGATIRGLVFRAEGPSERASVPIPENLAAERAHCGAAIPADDLLTDEDGALEGAVVRLRGIERGKAPPDLEPARRTLDQVHCRFDPHILIVPRGTSLRVTNSDPFDHTFGVGDATFRQSTGASQEVPLGESGIATVRCDIHTWMRAYVVVAEHPYYALTTRGGAYRLDGVPPGRYTIEVWHERLGSFTAGQEVEVRASEDKAVSFEIPIP